MCDNQADFWEHLGRTVATFGYLEDALVKGIYVFEVMTKCDKKVKDLESFEKWYYDTLNSNLLKNMSLPFGKLVKKYHNLANNNSLINKDDVIKKQLKFLDDEVVKFRNMFCHAGWRVPDKEGKSLPIYLNNNGEYFKTPVGTEFLQQTQKHIAELICLVMEISTILDPEGRCLPSKPGIVE
ncbi:hypothetical protein BJAS_P4254 [Bathymodiolus japonicus methanotrophic gill symbiont]|uniref:hypothetical protein n=1 Tax=Bathymodiolus japonicus methanotrophic gill symbiont TaxID=113269 RepID=UPI001B77D445|nr:hypothetical protein [Bathymodiolus japonicus methanotrophic gill symbiont]GFO73340.1 hypothetical protein BJAS_P4097 [Bathymodiolus japonicus methanotrophic gill symbiont]GFO73443.1 hypothetical protein BJAS_P4254 [Bathymodiolus japonicus methanotrophic gill symbiont]